jgi:hypothetical protein
MATYAGYQITRSFTSACDFNSGSGQYTFVRAGSIAGEVTGMAPLLINSSPLGVLQNDPKQGDEATVCLFGLTKIRVETEDAASPLTFGGLVKCASSGKAIGTDTTKSASINVVGVALEAVASGSGSYIEMWFTGPHVSTANLA